ncbi:MAG: ClpXP protease specificity-enhancing factor [Burkholderiales bacterium]
MKETPTTPYLIRAIWEWCTDNGYTPFLSVKVNEDTRVPQEFVRNGEIVLNLSSDATRNLKIGNDRVQFSARFGGASREVSVPINAVSGIFAKENGQGLAFAPVQPNEESAKKDETEARKKEGSPPSPPGSGRPKLHVVK